MLQCMLGQHGTAQFRAVQVITQWSRAEHLRTIQHSAAQCSAAQCDMKECMSAQRSVMSYTAAHARFLRQGQQTSAPFSLLPCYWMLVTAATASYDDADAVCAAAVLMLLCRCVRSHFL